MRGTGSVMLGVAGMIPNMMRQRIAKEFTEYSCAELDELLAGQPTKSNEAVQTRSSDDFEPAAPLCMATPPLAASMALGKTQPLCKEFSEFSEHELASVMLVTGSSSLQRMTSDDYRSTDISDGEHEVDKADADPEIPAVPAWSGAVPFCKEHTEYSQQELEELAPSGRAADGHRAPAASSDDFCICNDGQCPAHHGPDQKSPCGGPMCKELTEYSLNELTSILDKPRDEQPPPEAKSSDDFFQPASTFASFYHRNCMTGTGEHVQKRFRRVYHNRRKTAWTDYDEDGKVVNEEGAEGAEAVEAAPEPEVAEVPALVRLLKGEDGAAATAPTREKVKEVAQREALEKRVSMQKVLEATGPGGWTPLLVAVQRKQTAAVTALLELGADVECKEPTCGWTPLMYAAQTGKKDLIKQLLARGANVNACSVRHKWSPLCSAIQSGNEEVVHMLLAAGACLQAVKRQHPAIADTYRQDMVQYQGPVAATTQQTSYKTYRTDYSQSS